MITIFQESKNTIWETKTTLIIDFKDQSKQISPYNIIPSPWAGRKLFENINKKNYFETRMQEGTSMVIQFWTLTPCVT